MNKLFFAAASLDDIGELIKLENICFETDRLHSKQFRRFIQSPTALVTVAKKENDIVANAIILFRKNSKIARLYSIAVDPDFQQHGIGRSLYDFVERELIKNAYAEIRLEVRKDNQRAIYFYQKHHYEIFGEYKNFYEDGADALRMRKSLIKQHGIETD